MFLNGLNCVRKFQYDLEKLLVSRYRSNPSFLLEIKILFQKITEESVHLQNSILKHFKDIEYKISKQELCLSERTNTSEVLSELSAVQVQFNIIIEIQADIEKKLRKKKWYSDKLELVIKTPSPPPEPELTNRPQFQIRKPKRKIGNETRIISQNTSRGSDMIPSSQIFFSENNPKKKMEILSQEPSEVLEMANIEVDTLSQDTIPINIHHKQTFHQQTNIITNKQEQLSQEIESSKKVDMILPFSSLSLNNNFSKETSFPSNLLDCSQTEENENNDIHELSLSQELFPMKSLFRKKANLENESSKANLKEKINEKPFFLFDKQEITQLNISNPSCDYKAPEIFLEKHSQASNITKSTQPLNNISQNLLQTSLNPIKTLHKQSSILKYVSPPRNQPIIHDKSAESQSLPHKNTAFSGKVHQTKPNHFEKLQSTGSNPDVVRKSRRRSFYSMNILMIQREEIIYDIPESFWTSDEFPPTLISQLEDDLASN